ncbi:MAG TPA: hypothetical protein VKT82_24465 [Ktedonobacterales bacterium]|nr:hypothetical protein [Ktedonobacterales bacterium]
MWLSEIPAISNDQGHHKLVFHEHIIALGPTKYALALALWKQRQLHYRSGGQEPLCLGAAELGQLIANHKQNLQRQISRANVKLLPLGLEIVCLHSHGYALFCISELARLPANREPHLEG